MVKEKDTSQTTQFVPLENTFRLWIYTINSIYHKLSSSLLRQLVNDCVVTGWGKDAFSATYFNSQLKKVQIVVVVI